MIQYHSSGRHYVQFMSQGEGLWLNMMSTTFHIIERYPAASEVAKDGYESKETMEESKIETVSDDYVYVEPLTIEYAYAQSILSHIYGLIETGHKTKGHTCITERELSSARVLKESFLYGELLPRGANKALSSSRLNAAAASVLFDLGMGTGKIPIQAFAQFANLDLVYGVELSSSRYSVAETAAWDMVTLLGRDKFIIDHIPGKSIRVTEIGRDGDTAETPIVDMEKGVYRGRRGRVLLLEVLFALVIS